MLGDGIPHGAWSGRLRPQPPGTHCQTPIVSPCCLPRVVPASVLTALPSLSSAREPCDPEMPDKAAQSEVSLALLFSFHRGAPCRVGAATQNSTSQPKEGDAGLYWCKASLGVAQVQKAFPQLELRVWGKWGREMLADAWAVGSGGPDCVGGVPKEDPE